MTNCLDCIIFFSGEDLLRQVIICNDNGQVAFKVNTDTSLSNIILEDAFNILQEDLSYILTE